MLGAEKAVYRLCEQPPLAADWKLRDQLRESVAGPPSHLAEGFGRFSPPDFARFTVMARASLMESQNHLHDAVDRNHISETVQTELNALAEAAIQQVTGLMEYLQSPEALRNARRARERRMANRGRDMDVTPNRPSHNDPAGRPLRAPAPPQHASGAHIEHRTPNAPRRTEPEHEPSTENREE